MTAREVLDQIEQRAAKATPGPWEPTLDSPAAYPFVWAPEEGQEYTDPGAVFIAQTYRDDANAMADPEFIARARTDVPKLVAALRAVLGVVESQPHLLIDEDGWYSCSQAVYDDPTLDDDDQAACLDDTRRGRPCDCGRDALVAKADAAITEALGADA